MFEYHEPNLTIDADGVSVTVALAESLDIEKPLAGLDLTAGEVTGVNQFVISRRDNLPRYIDAGLQEEEADDDYFVNGYTPSDWDSGVDYKGEGNEEVIARAVPFLELGVRGLITFCQQEAIGLHSWLYQAEIHSDELERLANEHAEAAAAELERVMPKRDTAIAWKEFKQFVDEHCVELQKNGTYLWKEVDGKQLVFYQSLHSVGFWDKKGEYFSTDGSIKFTQEFTPEKWNDHIGEVTVSDRGYFTATKKTALDEIYDNKGSDSQDFLTVEEALNSLIPFVLEGEKDSSFNLYESNVRGSELPDEEELEL